MSAAKSFVRDVESGAVEQVDAGEAKKRLESGDYVPATASDKADADKRAANSTTGAQIKTAAESAAAGAIDTIEAPIALPLRANAALWGDKDPLEHLGGRATIENAATIFGDAREGSTGQTGEAYGHEYAENARARAAENPTTAALGYAGGGILAGGALSGGAGAIGGSAAKALGGGGLARAAGAVTGGALEGASYSQAQAGEEAYLHNIPLSGEKLVAAMGWGALLGGGVSLAAHGAGALLRNGSRGATPIDSPRLNDNGLGVPGEIDVTNGPLDAADGTAVAASSTAEAEPGKVSSALRDFADERTAKALGARGSTLKTLGRTADAAESTMHDMAQTVRGVALDDGTPVFRALDSQPELAERVAQAKRETGAKLGAFREEADKVFEAHPEIAPRPDALAERIQKEIIEPLETHPSTLERAKADPIRQVANDLRALRPPDFAGTEPFPTKVSDLTKLRENLDDQIYKVKHGVNPAQQGAPPNLKDLERARMIIEDSIEASSDKAATFFDKSQAQSYKEVKTQYRHLRLASDIAGAAELQNLGNRIVSPSDYGAGLAGAALGAGPIGAISSGIAHKAVREHSSAVLAVLADKLANNLDGKIESGLGAFFRESTARAQAGIGAAESVPVPIRRITTPAAVEAFQGRHGDLATAYDKRVAELSNANRDMGAGVRASMQTAMGGGYEAMPRLTQAATVTATRGAQYLQSQLPSGTSAPTMFQPSRKIQPSDLQIREFAQKWSAVANPLSVIDDLRRGTVTHAQIDALQAVYPQMYAEVQQKALEKIRALDQAGKRMPFNDRLQLDLFLNLNGAGEPTLAGEFVDRVVAAQAAKQKQESQPKPHASGGGLTKIASSRQSGSETALGG